MTLLDKTLDIVLSNNDRLARDSLLGLLSTLVIDESDESNVEELNKVCENDDIYFSLEKYIVSSLFNARVLKNRLVRKTDVYKNAGIRIEEGNKVYDSLMHSLFTDKYRDNPCFYVKGVMKGAGFISSDPEESFIRDYQQVFDSAIKICERFHSNVLTLSMDPLLLAACAVYIADHAYAKEIDKPCTALAASKYAKLGFGDVTSTVSFIKSKHFI